MNSREDWEKLAAEHGIVWEEGPHGYLDQYGSSYLTLIHDRADFAERVLKMLGKDKYVVIRVFPHDDDHPTRGLTRMRFSSYPTKPEPI